MLTTKQKIALARLTQAAVMAFRRLFGYESETCVKRRGLRWQLDLREGIDFSIWLLGAFELRSVRAYERLIKSGDVVVDIGANIGAHTLHFGRAVGPHGRVVAFEPTDYAFKKLNRNAALNPEISPRIQCVQAMLVDHVEGYRPPPLYSSWPLSGEGGGHALHLGRLMPTTQARAITLDQFLNESRLTRLDWIKLDVDGYECRVLRGARESLRRWRPMIMLELSPYVLEEQGGSIEELVGLLADVGYLLKDISSGSVLPLDGAALRKLIPHGGGRNALAYCPRHAESKTFHAA